MPHRHGPGGLGGGAAPVFVRKNSPKLIIKTKKVDCENLQVRPRPPSYSCGQGPGRVPGPGLRGSWPRPASGRIRADRSFLVARPGSHLELMAWPDGRLIAKAGAIFGAPVAICWCFFCDFLVLFLLR